MKLSENRNESGAVRLPRRSFTPLVFAGLAALLCPSWLLAQSSEKSSKDKPKEEGTTRLRLEVTAGEANTPVENASIYVRYIEERKLAKDKKVEQNWKTNRDGVVKIPNLPRGKVLIQVIAEHWKTFGQWYELDQDEQTIKIRLQKPLTKWY